MAAASAAIDVDATPAAREECPFCHGDQIALHFNHIPHDEFRTRFYTDPMAYGILALVERVEVAVGGWRLLVRALDSTATLSVEQQRTWLLLDFNNEDVVHFKSASLKKPQDLVLHHTAGHIYLRRVKSCKSSRRTAAASVAFMGDIVLEPLPGSSRGTAAKARDCSLFVKGL